MTTLAHWSAYNARQTGRPVRELLVRALDHAGPSSAPRSALDLGAGAGIESCALVRAGWDVVAVDTDGEALRRAAASLDATQRPRLRVLEHDLATVSNLPASELVYAGYALPWVSPEAFPRLWRQVRDAVRPGGWLAVDLFGDRDSWAGVKDATFLTEAEVRALLDGLDVVDLTIEDAVGPSASGLKHWHVLSVVARRPVASGARGATMES